MSVLELSVLGLVPLISALFAVGFGDGGPLLLAGCFATSALMATSLRLALRAHNVPRTGAPALRGMIASAWTTYMTSGGASRA